MMIEKQELRKKKLQRLEEERRKHNQLKEERRKEAEIKKKQEQKDIMRGCLIFIIVVAIILLFANYNVIYNGIRQLIGLEEKYEKSDIVNTSNASSPIKEKTKVTTTSTIKPENQNSKQHNSVSSTFGRFPQASKRLLTASDLQGLSKYDLKIMRNEIFARHGFIFQTNEMKNYFQNQSWYKPKYRDVSSLLSNIEKKNLELIKRYE